MVYCELRMKHFNYLHRVGTNQLRIITAIFIILFFASFQGKNVEKRQVSPTVLASHKMNLDKRYANTWVNSVFKDNILLNLAYLRGTRALAGQPSWTEVEKPFTYSFILEPGKTFAFHEDVLPQYTGKVTKTSQAHFNSSEGFKSDGYLVGDGVCHLASLIYWAAKDAKLDAYAPSNHDFAAIPEIPREYGVAIYNEPGNTHVNAQENLYVTNNHTKPISFTFTYSGNDLQLSISEATDTQKLVYNK